MEVSVDLTKRARRRAFAAALAIAVCTSAASVAAGPTLRKIVDSADPVPGAPGATWDDISPFIDVAVDGDSIAFNAFSERSGKLRNGIYVHRGGSQPPQLIADSDSPRPGTDEPFFRFHGVSMDGGIVVFTNEQRAELLAGAYRHDGNSLQVIADQRTIVPGQGLSQLISVGDIDIHDGAVLFGGGASHHSFFAWHQDGLYLSAQGALGAVVDGSTPIPGGAGNFPVVGFLGLDANGFAFTMPHLVSTDDDGIYRNLGNGIEVVADLTTVAPGSGVPFTTFHGFGYGDGATALVGDAGGKSGVYVKPKDGPLRAVATTRTPYPGAAASFAGFFNRVAASAGRVAFLGFWNPPGQFSHSGLFVADGNQIVKIAEQGDQLDGRVVADVVVEDKAFDWPNLAFTVSFTDGSDAIYLASFAEGCIAGSTALCLRGRFEVELEWRSPPAFPALQPARVSALTTDQSGFFYFVDAQNLELMVKVLDGCALNGHYWVFAAAATNVEYTLTVTDTATDAVREYHNVLGERSPAVNDTSAFACP